MLIDQDNFRRLCRARELLLDQPLHPRTIADIARAVHISPFHFIRQYEALFGTTPHQSRIAARMHRARQLLAIGQLNVTEVCMEVGMSSLTSFSAHFLRETGQTPSAYQRHARRLFQIPGFPPQDLFPGCLSLMARLPSGAFRNFR